jgi:hypothetical protein
MPPRESVVIALLPWRARSRRRRDAACGDGPDGAPRPATKTGRSERKQRLFETDHLMAAGRTLISVRFDPGAADPSASGRVSRVRKIDGLQGGTRRTGALPRFGLRARRFFSDLLWRIRRIRSARTLASGPSRACPPRCGSGRIGSAVGTLTPSNTVRAGFSGEDAPAPGLVSHHETT